VLENPGPPKKKKTVTLTIKEGANDVTETLD
jgi:hypothetical protein